MGGKLPPPPGGGEKWGGDTGGVRSGPKAYRGRGPLALSGAEPRFPGRPRPTTGETRRDPRTARTGTGTRLERWRSRANAPPPPHSPQRRIRPLPPLRANKQHRGRGERLGGKGFSPSIGYASCLSARPRLSRDSRLFRLVGDHVTPLHRPPARGRRARPPPSPLRAVCKGKTAVKRAAGRSQ